MATSTLFLLLLMPCFSQSILQVCSLCSCVGQTGLVMCQNLNKFPEVSSFPINTTSIHILHSNLSSGLPWRDLQRLTNLKELVINYNTIKNITKFGPLSISNLRLDHNSIERIESGAFDDLKNLSKLSLTYNRLKLFPSFSKISKLTELILEGNEGIKDLLPQSLHNLPSLCNLDLEKTGITSLPDGIFQRNKALRKINLSGTKSLVSIHESAFEGASSLETLILDNTRIQSLPHHGLERLQNLSLRNVPNFWRLPSGLWSLREVRLDQYNGFLCCAFKLNVYNKDCTTRAKQRATEPISISTMETTHGGQTTPTSKGTTSPPVFTFPGGGGLTGPSAKTTPPPKATTSKPVFTFPGGEWWTRPSAETTTSASSVTTGNSGGWFPGGGGSSGGGGGGFGTLPSDFPTHQVNTFTWFTLPGIHNTTANPPSVVTGNRSSEPFYQCPDVQIEVKCFPEPDAFHPCEDIMGYTLLTIISAIVGLVALSSNLVVGIVLITSQRHLNVTRFLMCNLAFADFCLGLYLFILTCFSIDTHGEYYNYVRLWQHGIGCKVLGFLAVFSSELSLFTLVVITVERFYAIVYAMHLNARLSFRWAVRVMICGWVFAVLVAILPLSGASSYEKVAVCLPFDVKDAGSVAYVSILLLLNGCSFVLVVYLYARMLTVVVKGGDMEGAPKRNDKKVAKRMALLVFTDMACWAPIAFFGLLAAFGAPLISVTESKVLLVFFFPINSLCNPFLYVFFTKAFKREFFALLSRFGFCKFRALKYNGTLSSFLYSRSRRNQTYSNDDRRKRISTVSSPTQNEFKRLSTVSSPSFNQDFKSSNVDLVGITSKTEKRESIQMKGITNKAYAPESTQIPRNDITQIPRNAAKFIKTPSENEDDDVFIVRTSSPTNCSNSPKSILKKVSVVDKNPNNLEKIHEEYNHGCTNSEETESGKDKKEPFSSASPPATSKSIPIIENVSVDRDEKQTAVCKEDESEQNSSNENEQRDE